MIKKLARWFAIYLILQVGTLQFLMAQTQYEKARYLGYAVMTSFVLTLLSAFLIYHRKSIGWWLGLFVATVSIIGYVVTRTVALPGLAIEPWLYPYGVVGAATETLFVILFFVVRPWRSLILVDNEIVPPNRFGQLLPILGVFLLSIVSYNSYRWDKFAYQLGYHVHVGSYDAVCNTPFTSFEELEEKYGMQVSLAAVSMMDGVVDVRLKIVDPAKAEKLIVNQAALLVDTKFLVIGPHVHQHFRLKKDKIHFLFFPTLKGQVHAGSEVSLVIGSVRVEPMIVQ